LVAQAKHLPALAAIEKTLWRNASGLRNRRGAKEAKRT
jgi:hypothetical protein